MEIFLKHLADAKKYINNADHLAYVTYPLVNDMKIIMLITENVLNSLINIIDAFLHYERYFKRINSIPEDFHNKLNIFKIEISKRYNLDQEIALMTKDLMEIVETAKSSSFQFQRGSNIILCTSQFRTKTLSLKKVKDYINAVKILNDKASRIIDYNAGRF